MHDDAAVPVKNLRHVIGARWKRQGLLRPIPDQPVFHLVRDDEPNELTRQLSDHLDGGVPHVQLKADEALPGSEQQMSVALRELLDKVTAGLGRHDARRWQGRIRFHRYALASFLLQHNEEPPEPDEVPNRQARELLSSYVRRRLFGRKQQENEPDGQPTGAGARVDATVSRLEPFPLPWYLLLPAMLLAVILPRAAQPGILLIWTTRWFMRQRYLSPRESADFAGFAHRLLTTPSVHENAQQVRKLLTHALLEDLADAYARRPWRWKWVRREHYPVLLLQGVRPATTGDILIRLINDVRNETGARDPLLVVASGPEQLPTDHTPSETMNTGDWQKRLVEARRKRSPTAWYLPVQVGPPVQASGGGHHVSPWRGSAPVRRKRARVLRAVPALAVAVLVIGFSGWYLSEWRQHCWHWDPWAHGNLELHADGFTGGQCVGFTLANDHIFSPPETDSAQNSADPPNMLLEQQQRIAQLNRDAENEHRARPDLPFPTIFYYGIMTTTSKDSTALAATAEELRGVANAQEEARRAKLPTKVVVANGGSRMEHGNAVARKIRAVAHHADLVNSEERDAAERHQEPDEQPQPLPSEIVSPVVGVVGLGGSRDTTEDAVDLLGNAEIPTVGAMTSKKSVDDRSGFYYQIAPDNAAEAEVVGTYIDEHLDPRPKKVYIYNDPTDPYSRDLTESVQSKLAAIGFYTEPRSAETLNTVESGSDEVCRRENLLFFAGRADALNKFRDQLPCGEGVDHPVLLASDDVTKFALDRKNETDTPLHVVSFNSDPSPESAGRTALADDAMLLLREAVSRVGAPQDDVQLTGTAVQNELDGIDRLTKAKSGILDYSGDARVPKDKAITIQRLEGEHVTNELACGQQPANLNGPGGCTDLTPGTPQ